MSNDSAGQKAALAGGLFGNIVVLADRRSLIGLNPLEAAKAALTAFRTQAEKERAAVRAQMNTLANKLLETEDRLKERERVLVDAVNSAGLAAGEIGSVGA